MTPGGFVLTCLNDTVDCECRRRNAIERDVCYWPKADMRERLVNVRYWRHSGHQSAFAPNESPRAVIKRYTDVRAGREMG